MKKFNKYNDKKDTFKKRDDEFGNRRERKEFKRLREKQKEHDLYEDN